MHVELSDSACLDIGDAILLNGYMRGISLNRTSLWLWSPMLNIAVTIHFQGNLKLDFASSIK